MPRQHFVEGEVGEYVGIMQQNRFVKVAEQRKRREYAAAGLEQQFALDADMHVQTRDRVCIEIVDYLSGEVVDINHRLTYPGIPQLMQHAAEHRHSADLHQRLGVLAGEIAETRAEAGSKDYRFHLSGKTCSICCSRWTSSTLTPNLLLRCSAMCWAL